MKKIIFALALLISQIAYADDFNFSWTAPEVTSSNGAAAGYRLYISSTSGTYGATPRSTVTGLTTTVSESTIGKYYAVVTAFNASGESEYSNEVSFEVKLKPPAPPTGLSIIQKIVALFNKAFRGA